MSKLKEAVGWCLGPWVSGVVSLRMWKLSWKLKNKPCFGELVEESSSYRGRKTRRTVWPEGIEREAHWETSLKKQVGTHTTLTRGLDKSGLKKKTFPYFLLPPARVMLGSLIIKMKAILLTIRQIFIIYRVLGVSHLLPHISYLHIYYLIYLVSQMILQSSCFIRLHFISQLHV